MSSDAVNVHYTKLDYIEFRGRGGGLLFEEIGGNFIEIFASFCYKYLPTTCTNMSLLRMERESDVAMQ